MPADMTPAQRALDRLRQLAREERAAVRAGDVEALCHIADLLPAATNALQSEAVTELDGLDEAISEICFSHAAAEDFLEGRKAAVATRLKECSGARRMLKGYAKALQKRAAHIDHQG